MFIWFDFNEKVVSTRTQKSGVGVGWFEDGRVGWSVCIGVRSKGWGEGGWAPPSNKWGYALDLVTIFHIFHYKRQLTFWVDGGSKSMILTLTVNR